MVALEIAILYHLFMTKDVWVPKNPLSKFEKQVWAMYSAGYGNNVTDKQWGAWRSKKSSSAEEFFDPPFGIPSRVFPQLGVYSSHDKFVVKKHMRTLARYGIDGILIPWLPPQEDKGFIDESVKVVFKQAKKIGLSVAIQIMNYQDRDNETVNRDINYIRARYAYDDIYVKFDRKPIVFIYDPHHIENLQTVVPIQSKDLFFIGSIVDHNHLNLALENGFHGIYSYFASEGQTWGSITRNWKNISHDCESRDMLFIPTVSPGYYDSTASPMSWDYTKKREGGEYYKRMFDAAIQSGANIIMINSFNNWLEGTAIEPIVPREDYRPTNDTWGGGPNFYLDLTKSLIGEYKK